MLTAHAFEPHLRRWRLVPDGAPVITATSRLLPVRLDGRAAMLKIAVLRSEKRGARLMRWWEGDGAATVLAYAADAILLERADNPGLLAAFARTDRDDDATRIICATVGRLHLLRFKQKPKDLVPLQLWFQPLFATGKAQGGVLGQAAFIAAGLLDAEQEPVVLHGDIHHGNILDFGPRGWLAIDPKGLWGERGFDYANIVCNPDHDIAARPGRLVRQVDVIAATANLQRVRLLAWVAAWAGLSAAFFVEDGIAADGAFKIVELAISELAR